MMEIKKFNVLVSDNIAKEGIAILEEHNNIEVDVHTNWTHEELIENIGKYDGIIVRSGTKLRKDVIDVADKLKVIVRAGTGYDNIDVEACTKKGIVVMITPWGNSNAVVELTMGLMLDHARNISYANLTMNEGKWEKKKLKGYELKGKTVGIIGLGRIGAGVAKRCQAFEMNTIAYDKFIPKKRAEEIGVKLVDNLDELITKADYITIHLPLTPQTKDLINKDELAKMKKNAVIINVARGGVVNEEALNAALRDDAIAGACIDVYSQEPAKKEKFPFIGLKNCITTPHLGANTYEAQIKVAEIAAQHVIQALISKIFIDAVNIPFKLSEDLADIYRPYMLLGAQLAKMIGQFNTSRITKVTIRYKGEIFTKNFEPIRAVILQSIFENRLTESITFMNAEAVLKENGIEVVTEQYAKPVNFENYIKIYIDTESGMGTKMAGTVFSEQPKVVEINGLYFDFAPTDYMLVLQNKDIPGVLGAVGSLLGEHDINIAGLQLGRKEKGSDAVSIILIDDEPTIEMLNKLKSYDYIIDAKFISC